MFTQEQPQGGCITTYTGATVYVYWSLDHTHLVLYFTYNTSKSVTDLRNFLVPAKTMESSHETIQHSLSTVFHQITFFLATWHLKDSLHPIRVPSSCVSYSINCLRCLNNIVAHRLTNSVRCCITHFAQSKFYIVVQHT